MDSLLSITVFYFLFIFLLTNSGLYFSSLVLFLQQKLKNVYYQSLPEQSVSTTQPLLEMQPSYNQSCTKFSHLHTSVLSRLYSNSLSLAFPLLTTVCGQPQVSEVRLNKPPSKPYYHLGQRRVAVQQGVWFEALTGGHNCLPAKENCPGQLHKQQLYYVQLCLVHKAQLLVQLC